VIPSAFYEGSAQMARLGDICEMYAGLNVSHGNTVETGGVRLVRASDLREAANTLSHERLQQFSLLRDVSERLRLRPGDILLPRISRKPRAVLVPSDLGECYAHHTLIVLRPTASAPPPSFLADYLRSKDFQESAERRASRLGDALHLFHAALADIPIPIPVQASLSETKQPETQVVRSRIILANDQLIEHLRRQPYDLHNLAPRRFEELIAALLEDMGWEVSLTKQTRDGGRDILAFLDTDIGRLLCLVEAKRYSPDRPVGVELVRNLYGALSDEQANSALLVTTSYFSPDAREFQRRHVYQLSLREYQDVVGWLMKCRRQ
jgi:hypothetical protein